MRVRSNTLSLLTITLLLLLPPSLPVRGAEKGDSPALWDGTSQWDVIYAINFFDGQTYSSAIVPYSVHDMYLLADHVNALVVRETQLYYWPLTSEFKADWAARNIPLPGKICIVNSRGDITKIGAEPYAIQYDMTDIAGTIQVYWGEEAYRMRELFMQKQRNYAESVHAYNEAMGRYNTEVNDILADPHGELRQFPEVPIAPENFTLLSTEVNIGFPLKLSEGRYSLYFQDPEGKVLEQTRKNLIIFSALEKSGGFRVFEEGRWTRPEDFPRDSQSLYSIPGALLYLEPYRFQHYRGSPYSLMMNPQERYSRNKYSIYVPIARDESLQSLSLGKEQINLRSYKVTQLAGSKLGYIINELPLGDKEGSFTALRLSVKKEWEGRSFTLGEGGRGGQTLTVIRLIRFHEFYLVLFALLPLLYFVMRPMVRKRRSQ